MKTDAFDSVKGQIGCCGIWCGSCVVGAGVLPELTRRYKDLITAYAIDQWGPRHVDYQKFFAALDAIQQTKPCPGCLKGGGRDDCELRACVRAKGIGDCSVCSDRSACGHAELLEQMRSGAVGAGLLVKDGDAPREQLLQEWTAVVKTRWPFSVLFND